MNDSERTDENRTSKEVWEAAIATFFSKLVFASAFFIPVLLFDLKLALYISIGWSIFILGVISYWMARERKRPALSLMAEHWLIAVVVIIITHFMGVWVNATFN